jgi:transposase-like protein
MGWKTRTRGTKKQIGKKFPVKPSRQALTQKLPKIKGKPKDVWESYCGETFRTYVETRQHEIKCPECRRVWLREARMAKGQMKLRPSIKSVPEARKSIELIKEFTSKAQNPEDLKDIKADVSSAIGRIDKKLTKKHRRLLSPSKQLSLERVREMYENVHKEINKWINYMYRRGLS